jgi:cytoskeleton protein RodZ
VTRSEAEVAELPTDPGARLRRQRELAGLSEQQVAEQLNLDVVAVLAIEQDDYATLGAPVFARGHLKRYAALLGLAEEEILGAYERSRAQLAQPTLVPKSRGEMPPERGPARWPWIMGSLLLFLMAAGLAAYVSEHGLRLPKWPFGGDAAPAASTADTAAEAPPAQAPVQPAPQASVPFASSGSSAVAADASSDGAPTPATGVPAGQPGQVVLQVRFAADSWVEIYDGSGKAVLYDLGQAGTERTVTGMAPLSVTFGNAPAVTLLANGRPIALPAPPAGQTVGRYSVGADGALR